MKPQNKQMHCRISPTRACNPCGWLYNENLPYIIVFCRPARSFVFGIHVDLTVFYIQGLLLHVLVIELNMTAAASVLPQIALWFLNRTHSV